MKCAYCGKTMHKKKGENIYTCSCGTWGNKL
jgi:hypothetical protein